VYVIIWFARLDSGISLPRETGVVCANVCMVVFTLIRKYRLVPCMIPPPYSVGLVNHVSKGKLSSAREKWHSIQQSKAVEHYVGH